MIRRAKPEDFALLPATTEAALRILGLYAAYGLQQTFVRFWCAEEQDKISAWVSLLDGAAVLAVVTDDEELLAEIALFFTMQPEVHTIRTSEQAGRALMAAGGWLMEAGAVMTPGEHLPVPEKQPQNLSPRQAYPLLASCFDTGVPPFEAWYVDVSHRLRHGYCRLIGFMDHDEPIACAMTTAECERAALIGAVATLPAGRGQGYASANVLTLAHQLRGEGKTALLSPKNPAAQTLYARIGFTVCGQWASLKRPPQ